MEDEKPLLEVFEGAWDVLPIYLFLKENGDGQYHLADLVRKSGYGKDRFKTLLKLLKEAGLIEYSLNRGSGLKSALTAKSGNPLYKSEIRFIKLKSALLKKRKSANLDVGKRSKQLEACDNKSELRSSLTSFSEKLSCAPRALPLQGGPPPGAVAPSPGDDDDAASDSGFVSSLAKQPVATQQRAADPIAVSQANSNQVAHAENGPRQGAVRLEYEDTTIKVKEIEQLWNKLAEETGIKRIETIDLSRRMQVDEVLREFPDTSTWIRAFDQIRKSKFLRKAGWFNFGWILRRGNFLKILEGDYEREIKISKKEKPERSVHWKRYTEADWENQHEGPFELFDPSPEDPNLDPDRPFELPDHSPEDPELDPERPF